MTVDNAYPENINSFQIVKSFTSFNKQDDKYQHQRQQQKLTPDLSMISSPELAEEEKMDYRFYKSSPQFLTKSASSTFLSVLLQDVSSVTQQQFFPNIMNNSSLSLRCTSTTTANNSPTIPWIEEDNGDEEDATTAVELRIDDDKQANNEKALKATLIKQLQLKVKKQEQEISILKACLTLANQKLQDVTEKADRATQEKQQTEDELEDLSTQLFEQANEMVARERRVAKKHMESAAHELKLLRNQLDRERSLRQHISYCSNNEGKEQQSIMMIQPSMDVNGLALFRDFVQRVRSVSSLEYVHLLPFIKQCLEQDIYPCLQRMKKLSGRKLLNSLVRRRCQIEKVTASVSTPSSPPSTCCYACGARISHCHREANHQEDKLKETRNSNNTTPDDVFQFRLNNNDKSWQRIDRPCKDRLLAVSNFYEFIRHLHLGLQGQQRSIESLFHEMVWLRLYMFWARSGIMIKDDISAESTLLTIFKLFDARSYLFC
ncbi:hypothetical protein INT45_009634 [Circinella minor]|uniref:GDP/GTP exchange factor Sec2 N-terminal domain-containing protein n=1 Tax=Circinella minor TaxID=1195481 RepID=A0A8H7VPI5_9FUNG|nr:hypothetical protein INT45_009634 [Circinella minor]